MIRSCGYRGARFCVFQVDCGSVRCVYRGARFRVFRFQVDRDS